MMDPASPAPAPGSSQPHTGGVGAQMIGASAAHLAMVDRLARIAESEAPALIEGETGGGKELAARGGGRGIVAVARHRVSFASRAFQAG